MYLQTITPMYVTMRYLVGAESVDSDGKKHVDILLFEQI